MARNDEYCQVIETLGRFSLVGDDQCRWWTTTEAYEAACREFGGETPADPESGDNHGYESFCRLARNLTKAEGAEMVKLIVDELADGRELEEFKSGEGEEPGIETMLRDEEEIAVAVANKLMERAGLEPCFVARDDGSVTDGGVEWGYFNIEDAREAAGNLINQAAQA